MARLRASYHALMAQSEVTDGAAPSLDAAAAKVAKTNTNGEKKTAAADPAVTSTFKGGKVSTATNKVSKV